MASPLPADGVEQRRIDYERMLMEADRMTMQIVQTSLSLIGFGFTINAFFEDVAVGVGALSSAGARTLGLGMLALGLLLLSLGTWNQASYRRELRRRYALEPGSPAWGGFTGRFTASFITALLLMALGLISLVVALLRWLL